jgi:hypothetical protein
MPLFEVAILEKPTKKEAEDGAIEKLVFGPRAVVAKDSQTAAILAAMDSKLTIAQDRMEVLTRPFK